MTSYWKDVCIGICFYLFAGVLITGFVLAAFGGIVTLDPPWIFPEALERMRYIALVSSAIGAVGTIVLYPLHVLNS